MTARRFAPLAFALIGWFLSLPFTEDLSAQQAGEISVNDQALTLVQEGVALRREGKIEEAMEKYQQALKLTPENPNVLYELCYTHFQLGEYKKSIKFGERGAKYPSELQGQFYTVIGSCYDNQKKPEKAIAAYRKGIDLVPNAPMIRYNLALTYANTGKLEEAEETIKEELLINPEHASSHFLLALLYNNRNERIPALLATSRFLILEPDGPRSAEVLRMVEANLTQGISKGKNDGEEEGDVNILFNMSESTEGDFKAIEMMLGLLTAGTAIDSVPKSEYQNMQKVLDLTFGMIGEKGAQKMGKGFAAEYYIPFFVEVHKQGYTAVLLRTLMMSHDDPEAQAWLSEVENMKKIQQFVEWSGGFEWKRG